MTKENYRTEKKNKNLKMLNSGKARKNHKGEIVRDAVYQSKSKVVGRIEPNRNWFTPTKFVEHNELDKYRNNIRISSPYDVLLATGKVPGSLINTTVKKKKYENVYNLKFDDNNKRIKTSILNKECRSIKDIKEKSFERIEMINLKNDNLKLNEEKIFRWSKGSSKETWKELYKVLDSSDVIVHVLDVRNPKVCEQIEKYLDVNKHKYLVYVLNKVDLVPKNVTGEWIKTFKTKHPVISYQTVGKNYNSRNHGKDNLIQVLKQLKKLYLLNKSAKPCISVGFVGYPNTGKSSIINSLRGKDVCNVAPIPGETKVWQYITLFSDIYLIDSPGVIPRSEEDSNVISLINGGVRVENLKEPDLYIWPIIQLVKKEIIIKKYSLKKDFTNSEEFFDVFGKRMGMLLKGGLVDVNLISRRILQDFIRGGLPFYVSPTKEGSLLNKSD